jgi:uncharacterized membrane protein YiaA
MTLRRNIVGLWISLATLSHSSWYGTVLKMVTLGDASSAILKDNYKSIVAADAMVGF